MKKVLIVEPDRLAKALRTALDILREIGGFGDPSYGFFLGGDPNNFTPDAESVTPEEMARWKTDCAKWRAGDHTPTPSSCSLNEEPMTLPNKQGEKVTHEPGSILLTRSFYGLGTNLDVAAEAIRADLEDLWFQCIEAQRESAEARH